MRRGTWQRHTRGAVEIGPASRSEEVGLARRFGQLAIGLIAYGLSLSLIVIARLGVDPWDVFQQGLARHTGIAIGMKPAGGIKTAKQSLQFLIAVKETLGDAWLTPKRYRFGASSLLNDLLRQTEKERTGAYQAPYYFSDAAESY